jgi:nucleoid-associated protein YgaU
MPSAPQLDPRPASHQSAAQRSVIYRLIFSTALIASAAAFIAPLANAQDLGEIARQERAKKQSNPAPPATHVYTNEDVKREEILTPEDKTRFSATTQPANVKPAQSATQLASESTPPGNADRLIGARPQILIPTTTPKAILASAQNSIRQPIAQKIKQFSPQKNISSAPTMRAKTNPTPTTRANISAASSQPPPTPIPVAAAQPVTQVFAQTVINDAPSPAIVPLDQMPLGNVARYYRARKRQFALANAQIEPGPVNATSAPTVATTIPAPLQLSQMPLGDVARYYRAKKREEDAAIASFAASTPASNPVPPFSATPVQSAPAQSAISRPSKVSTGRYPLTIATLPLASMKPPAASPDSPPAARVRRHNLTRTSPLVPTARPNRAVSHATSIRVLRGDTLWQLARRYLGTGTRWRELISLNPTIQDPRHLQIGSQLVLHYMTG